jgi:hypothetical protein
MAPNENCAYADNMIAYGEITGQCIPNGSMYIKISCASTTTFKVGYYGDRYCTVSSVILVLTGIVGQCTNFIANFGDPKLSGIIRCNDVLSVAQTATIRDVEKAKPAVSSAPVGVIIGGAAAGVAVIGAGICYWWRKRRHNKINVSQTTSAQ